MDFKSKVNNGIESIINKEIIGEINSKLNTQVGDLGYYATLYSLIDSENNKHLIGFSDCSKTEYQINIGDKLKVKIPRFGGVIVTEESTNKNWKKINSYAVLEQKIDNNVSYTLNERRKNKIKKSQIHNL